MKKEKLSFVVLLVEIVAIAYLHSAKNKPAAVAQGNNGVSATYQLKALPITKLK